MLQLQDLPTLNVDLTPLLDSLDVVYRSDLKSTVVSKETVANNCLEPVNDFHSEHRLCSVSTSEKTSVLPATGTVNPKTDEISAVKMTVEDKQQFNLGPQEEGSTFLSDLPSRSLKQEVEKLGPNNVEEVKATKTMRAIISILQKNAGFVENRVTPIVETAKSDFKIKPTESLNSFIFFSEREVPDSKLGPLQLLDDPQKINVNSMKEVVDSKSWLPPQLDCHKEICDRLRSAIDYLLKCFHVPLDMNIACVALHSLYSIRCEFRDLPPVTRNELIRSIFHSFSAAGVQHLSSIADVSERLKAVLFITYMLSINGKRIHYRKLLIWFHDLNGYWPDGADDDSSGFKYFRRFDSKRGIRIFDDGYVVLSQFPPPEMKLVTVSPKSVARKGSASNAPSCSDDRVKNASHEACKRIAHGIRYLLEYFGDIPKYDGLRIVLYVLTDAKDFFLSSTSTLQSDMLNKCFFCFHSIKGKLVSKAVGSRPSSVLKNEEKDVLFMAYLLHKESMFYGNLFDKCKDYKREVPPSALTLSDQRKYILERKKFFKLEANGYVKLHPLPAIEQLKNETANAADCNMNSVGEETKMDLNRVKEIPSNARASSHSRKRSWNHKAIDPLTNFFTPEPGVPAKSAGNASKSSTRPSSKKSVPPGFPNRESLEQSASVRGASQKYYDDLVDACLKELEKKKYRPGAGTEKSAKKPKFTNADHTAQEGLGVGSSRSASSPSEARAVNFFTFFLSQYRAGVSPDMLLTHMQVVASDEIQTHLKDCYAGDVVSFFASHPKVFYLSPSGNVYLKG